MENPIETKRPGKAGTGSRNGRSINHEATGTRPSMKIRGNGRGVTARVAGAMVRGRGGMRRQDELYFVIGACNVYVFP